MRSYRSINCGHTAPQRIPKSPKNTLSGKTIPLSSGHTDMRYYSQPRHSRTAPRENPHSKTCLLEISNRQTKSGITASRYYHHLPCGTTAPLRCAKTLELYALTRGHSRSRGRSDRVSQLSDLGTVRTVRTSRTISTIRFQSNDQRNPTRSKPRLGVVSRFTSVVPPGGSTAATMPVLPFMLLLAKNFRFQ